MSRHGSSVHTLSYRMKQNRAAVARLIHPKKNKKIIKGKIKNVVGSFRQIFTADTKNQSNINTFLLVICVLLTRHWKNYFTTNTGKFGVRDDVLTGGSRYKVCYRASNICPVHNVAGLIMITLIKRDSATCSIKLEACFSEEN